MTSAGSHLCIIGRVPNCGCIVRAYPYHADSTPAGIKFFLNNIASENLHAEIVSHRNTLDASIEERFPVKICPHVHYYNTQQMPSAEAVRRADEIYKAIQVMRELA